MSEGLERAGIFFDPTTGLVRNFSATPNVRLRTQSRTLFASDITPVADPVAMRVYAAQPRGFIGIEFYDDLVEQDAQPVAATAGTVALDVITAVNMNVDSAGEPIFEPITDGPSIDAAAPTTSSYGSPVETVRARPAGIAGAVGYRLVVFTSET